ncbi:MAG: hypothetical protein KJS97_08755 [Alphaproteobacteria bacterium]|nr:hypothetical protein [Alphaproteobacteria bacterium]
MDEKRFRDILDAYGGAPRRWPADERAAAEAFLRDRPEAAQWVAEAAALDATLDAADADAAPRGPSDLLVRRLLTAAPRSAPLPRFAGAALAAALAMGVLLGFGGVRAAEAGAEAEALMTASFDGLAFLDDGGLGG